MKYYIRKLAKYDFSKYYSINRLTIHATLNPCNCNNQSISYFDNFVFAVIYTRKDYNNFDILYYVYIYIYVLVKAPVRVLYGKYSTRGGVE